MTGFQTEPWVPSARSPFVTRVAWYSILLYGFATVLSALYGLAPPPAVPPPKVIPESEVATLITWIRGDLNPLEGLAHTVAPTILSSRVGMLFALALNVGTLIAGTALLRRRPWAPWTFIVMLILGVVEGAASLIFDVVPRFHTVWAVGLIAWAVLCVWITSKLLSAPARAEFDSTTRSSLPTRTASLTGGATGSEAGPGCRTTWLSAGDPTPRSFSRTQRCRLEYSRPRAQAGRSSGLHEGS